MGPGLIKEGDENGILRRSKANREAWRGNKGAGTTCVLSHQTWTHLENNLWSHVKVEGRGKWGKNANLEVVQTQ